MFVHPLAQLVHIFHHLPLIFPQAFELMFDGLAFGLAAGLFQCGLQFLEPLVEILLAASQLLEPVENLQLFFLGFVRRRGRLALRFVAVFVLGQFQLVQLLLGTVPGAAATTGSILSLGHHELFGHEL